MVTAKDPGPALVLLMMNSDWVPARFKKCDVLLNNSKLVYVKTEQWINHTELCSTLCSKQAHSSYEVKNLRLQQVKQSLTCCSSLQS